MSYCAIEEAFAPLNPGPTKKSKKSRTIVVPTAPSNSDAESVDVSMSEGSTKELDRPAQLPPSNDVLTSPPTSSRLEAASSTDFFPMQGSNAEPEAWQKAFLLGGDSAPVPKPTFSVQGKPTLWRSIQKPIEQITTAFTETLAPIPDEINRRLDSLTQQLEALTTPTPMQNTAELFLFVAIGLLLLLAIDTLLRYASLYKSPSLSSLSSSSSSSSFPSSSSLPSLPSVQVMSGGGWKRGGRR